MGTRGLPGAVHCGIRGLRFWRLCMRTTTTTHTTTTELELKFAFDAAAAQSVAKEGYSPADAQDSSALRATYYDTPSGALAQACVALRVRRTPQGYVQTVKAQSETVFERWEHERPVAGPKPERGALPPPSTALGALVHAQFDALGALFTAAFRRSVWRVQVGRSLVLSISVDLGEFRASVANPAAKTLGKPTLVRAPIAELEVERVSGTRLAFLRWTLQFAARHPLRLLQDSKQEQGLSLCGRLPTVPPAVARAASALLATHSAAQASAVALQADIAHLLANTAALRQGQDPEAVHQVHIAIQRLRITVRAFGLDAQGRAWSALLSQAHALARTTGTARDADVFATQTWPAVCDVFDADAALHGFAHLVAMQRRLCTGQCRQAFCAAEGTAFALQVLYQSERVLRRYSKHARGKAQTDASLHTPVGAFLQAQLRSLAKRMQQRLQHAHTPQDWHRARLAVKRMRYTLELALPVLPAPKRHARVLRLLAKLQRVLGELNDQTMAGRTARSIAALADTAQPEGHTAQPLADEYARAVALVDAWSAQKATPQARLLAAVHRTQARLDRVWRKCRK